MKKSYLHLVLLFVSILACPVLAQDEEQDEKKGKAKDTPSAQERMSKLIALGPGVHEVKKDKKGRILSCMIVGQARVSTVLGKAQGLEVARDKAALACSSEFVKWLKEDVNVYQSSEDERIVLISGQEGGEDDSIQESAKAVEKTVKKMESVANGLVRGMQMLHKEVDSSGKTYTIVKGWKADTAEAAKAVTDNLKDGSSKSTSGKSSKDKQTKSKTKASDKELEDDVATSDDADEFFKGPK